MYAVEIRLADEDQLTTAQAWADQQGARATELRSDPLALWVLLDRAPDAAALGELTASATVRPAELLDHGSTWRASLRPRAVGPLWLTTPEVPVEAAFVVVLEPDAGAFGSGLHATTQLCLERIVALSPAASVLDVGAGSGVLALAALALGAERALAIELDPAARAVAVANAAHNPSYGAALEVRDADALRELDERFDLVLANILGPELIALAPAITRTLASRGTLLLSGIRPGLADEVSRRYVNLGLAELSREAREGWLLLELIARW